ncbi:MAG: class I SAM-dependent methyltransferase [Candidatus Marinimicrobia bacterium]|nr:class I SAM-dependent methyltransferase [Candidatus Neomarinimicrobiota bacterium]
MDLLDAGCGRGDFTNRLHQLFGFHKSLGIDFATAMLEVADGDYGQIPGLSFANVDLSQILPFENNKFDVSLALNILHHLLPDDQQNLIAELCRITKAIIVVEIKQPHILWRIRGGYRAFGYLQFYPSEIQLIEKLFLEQGYGLVATKPIFHFAAFSPIVLLIFKPTESNK